MLRKTLLAILIALLPVAAFAQGTGHFTAGHALRATGNGAQYSDGGGAAGSTIPGAGYLTELGITNTGIPLCINDALTNSPGGYHRLCFGANMSGIGAITYDAIGGATPQALRCIINGTSYSCVNTGSGKVVGPDTSVVGDAATFNSTDGTLIADAGLPPMLSAATNSALQALSTASGAKVLRMGFTTAGDAPAFAYFASNSPCSLNGGNGDNGSQVKSADNKCWLALSRNREWAVYNWYYANYFCII